MIGPNKRGVWKGIAPSVSELVCCNVVITDVMFKHTTI